MSQAFGQHIIRASEVFFRSALSVGFVNLKPILPGRTGTNHPSYRPHRCPRDTEKGC